MSASILDSLNLEQQQAVACTEGYVRVLAGAGTGKTKALTARYAYLVKELGLSPAKILCVTFTNKAAQEMKERIIRICGSTVSPWVTTFHGFCADFLRKRADVLGYPLNFVIIPVAEVKEILKPIYEQLGINGREFSLQEGWEYIDKLKSKDLGYVDIMLNADSEELLRLASLKGIDFKRAMFYLYLYQQRSSSLLDFDDLIAFTLTILKRHADIRLEYQKRLQYIEVDEFQDIDHLQYELVEILAAFHQNLFIVGDPDQTIYSFRGADVKFFTDFPLLHQGAKCFSFSQNYRSQGAILDCAYTLISKNPDNGRVHLKAMRKDINDEMFCEVVPLEDKHDKGELQALLRSIEGHTKLERVQDPHFQIVKELKGTPKPVVAGILNQNDEADFIAREIKLIRSLYPQSSVAVLYRAHSVSGKLEQALVRYKIPYKVVGDFNFFERREILDVLAFCRLCLNPKDDAALRRVINVPKRGFGKVRLQRLQKDAQALRLSLYETLKQSLDNPVYTSRSRIRDFTAATDKLIEYFSKAVPPILGLEKILNAYLYEEHLKQSGESERVESLSQLRQLAFDFENSAGEETTLADFLNHLVLYVRQDEDPDLNKVSLMTVHNAKGLEFDYVFVAALNEGVFPSTKAINFASLQEERRLLYVAMTRACRQLFLSSVNFQNQAGRSEDPSRFIEDFNVDEVHLVGSLVGLKARGSKSCSDCEKRFDIGDKVFHKIFGPGEILDLKESTGEYEIKFASLREPRTLSFSAPLESDS